MDASPRADLAAAVSARFYAVNGEHEMTGADDEYVTAWFATVEDVAARAGRSADEVRMLMLRDRLPLPSYIRSDGAQMVFRDVLGLIEAAGDVDAVPAWFAAPSLRQRRQLPSGTPTFPASTSACARLPQRTSSARAS